MKKVLCPKCGSDEFILQKKGFPWGEVAICLLLNFCTFGIFFWVIILLLPAWLSNTNQIEWVCRRCGHKWNNKRFI